MGFNLSPFLGSSRTEDMTCPLSRRAACRAPKSWTRGEDFRSENDGPSDLELAMS